MPKFSVIIPLYNKDVHIAGTIISVLNQSFTDYEIIVVNDGSTDDSLLEVQKISDERLTIYDRENNGVSQARNFAMQQAKGDYFAFLDADDIWKTNHLQNLNDLIIEFPNCGMYCANYCFDYGNNFIVNTKYPTLPDSSNWKGLVTNFFRESLYDRIACTIALAISKECFETLGGFNTNFTIGEDTEYWSKIALNYRVAFTKKISAIYKLNATNRTTDTHFNNHKYNTLDSFKKEEEINTSLNIFIDQYRHQYALTHKIHGNLKAYNYYKKNISLKNITLTKKILLILPSSILSFLLKLKQWLKTKRIDFYIP